jgi:hypothetical protein
MAAPDDAHGFAGRCAVERLGGRSAPVRHERFVVLVVHGRTPDVEYPAVAEVDAAEDQRLVADGQVRGALQSGFDERIA